MKLTYQMIGGTGTHARRRRPSRVTLAVALAVVLAALSIAAKSYADVVVVSDGMESGACGQSKVANLQPGTYALTLKVTGDCPVSMAFDGLYEPTIGQPLTNPPNKKKGDEFSYTFLVKDTGKITFTCEGDSGKCGFSYTITQSPAGSSSGTSTTSATVTPTVTPTPSPTPTPTPTPTAPPMTGTKSAGSSTESKATPCDKSTREYSYRAGQQLFVISVKDDSQCSPAIASTDIPDLQSLVGTPIPKGTTLVRPMNVPETTGGKVKISCDGDSNSTCDYDVKTDQTKASFTEKVDWNCGLLNTIIQLNQVGSAVLPAGWYELRVDTDPTSDCIPTVTMKGAGGTIPFEDEGNQSVSELPVPQGSGVCQVNLAAGDYEIDIQCASDSDGKKCKYTWTLSAEKVRQVKHVTPKSH